MFVVGFLDFMKKKTLRSCRDSEGKHIWGGQMNFGLSGHKRFIYLFIWVGEGDAYHNINNIHKCPTSRKSTR